MHELKSLNLDKKFNFEAIQNRNIVYNNNKNCVVYERYFIFFFFFLAKQQGRDEDEEEGQILIKRWNLY